MQNVGIRCSRTKVVQVFDGQNDLCCVELGEALGEFAHFAEVKEQLAARAIIEHKIQFVFGLK